jgi:hypothetical protein
MGDKYCSSGKKEPEPEANHSPRSSPEVKNKRSYTSAVLIRLLGMCGNNFAKFFFTRNNCKETEV